MSEEVGWVRKPLAQKPTAELRPPRERDGQRESDAARIAALEAENAALTETLRALFKSAAAAPVVSRETPDDTFPAAALTHGWATKGTSHQ